MSLNQPDLLVAAEKRRRL